MVDLKGQYEAIKEQIEAGFKEVIENTSFINGPQVKNFQKNLEKRRDFFLVQS